MKQTMDENGQCCKCGSKVALVDETVTHLEVAGEIVKTYSGDLHNRNCVRCRYPEMYPDFVDYDDKEEELNKHQQKAGDQTPSSMRKESSRQTKAERGD